MEEKLLVVEDLRTYYHSKNKIVPAVDGVSFTLSQGEVLGIVGESGCGKSTAARSVIGLLDWNCTTIESGSILFHGRDLAKLSPRELNAIRGKQISMVFQNPLSSLNPVFTVEDQICEVLRIHEDLSRQEARAKALELLQLVGIPEAQARLKDYPHQLSGGMQQRVLIAIALACNPEIVIADEPTTALDVTIQAQILELMNHLRELYQMGILLITHNMGVVAQMCHRILVMYGGVVVEEGSTEDIFADPRHPYTAGLLAAIPSIQEQKEELYTIPGTVPGFTHPVTSCRFADRCSRAWDLCRQKEPELISLDDGRRVRCHLYQQEGGSGNG